MSLLRYRTIVSPALGNVLLRCYASAPASFSQLPTGAGKTPPTLEEFDPLNPGEWQLGAAGKILPRLPEGTKCGKLVMGKYGLYDPRLRKQVELYSQALLDGAKSEEARPFDKRLTMIGKAIAFTSFLIGLWNLFVLFNGKLIWPYTNYKAPGQS
ncbi:unnamed protein product [Anisakis simplex]|uniref:Succinate dehydrogenase [ubiquinone] cytochrome b small subunit n=1 Tax=Anisakis simplex TaxID=6269 RepID=A0A0M3K5F2_ANISI|nr:unnamed protein product [Anisakis simplex]